MSQYFYVVVRYIYHPVLNFEAWEWIFCWRSGISDFMENVSYGWGWKDKNLSPSVPSSVQCSVFTSVQGFWGLIPHLDQVTLYLYQDSNEKNQFRSTLLFLLLNFQSWKEGLVFVIAVEISLTEKKLVTAETSRCYKLWILLFVNF